MTRDRGDKKLMGKKLRRPGHLIFRLPVMETLEARTVLCSISWSTSSGWWNTPTNWSQNMIPGSPYDVIIPSTLLPDQGAMIPCSITISHVTLTPFDPNDSFEQAIKDANRLPQNSNNSTKILGDVSLFGKSWLYYELNHDRINSQLLSNKYSDNLIIALGKFDWHVFGVSDYNILDHGAQAQGLCFEISGMNAQKHSITFPLATEPLAFCASVSAQQGENSLLDPSSLCIDLTGIKERSSESADLRSLSLTAVKNTAASDTGAVEEIRIGETLYPLHEFIATTPSPENDGSWKYQSNALGPEFIGSGETREAAERDWRESIHSAFQRLVAKQDWEMDDTEYATWQTLSNVIDVDEYKASNPIFLHSIGWISSVRPHVITWDSGRVEPITLDKVPAEFATYDVGQWFEAEFYRIPKTWELTKITKVEKREPMRDMTPAEVEKFWNSMTPTTALPVSKEVWGPRPDDVEDGNEEWKTP